MFHGKGLKPTILGRHISPYAIAALFFILGSMDAAAIFHYFFPAQRSDNPASYLASPSQTRYVDPLIYCDIAERKEFYEFKPLETVIRSKIDEEIGAGLADKIGIYFTDLKTGRWTGVNEDEKFSPASLLKTPVMIAYLKEAESDPTILDRKIIYDGSFDDTTKQNFKPSKRVEAGKSYTVDELLRYMMFYSDNNAAHLLIANADQDGLEEVFGDLGIPFPADTSDFVSPKTFSIFYRALYSARYLNREMSDRALELLVYNGFPQGLYSTVPKGIVIAQKFGEHSFPADKNGRVKRELHDCGIVYYPDRPYFVCVMTKGDDFSKLVKVIEDIGRLVYQRVDKNYGNL